MAEHQLPKLVTGVRFPSPALPVPLLPEPTPEAPGSGPDGELVARLRTAGCVFAEEEAALLMEESRGDERSLAAMVRRRESGEPIEYVVGWAEIAGVRLAVEPGVFVPRNRSELLVEEAVATLRDRGPAGSLVLDLCCGAGAVGAAIATAMPGIELHASDIDTSAVELSARNLTRFGAAVHQGDLYDALPQELRGRIDLIAANSPYVPTRELGLMPREARLYEPPWALDGGPDGMDPLRRIVAGAPDWLAPGGAVMIEAASTTANTAAAIAADAGLDVRVARSDALEVAVVVGSW